MRYLLLFFLFISTQTVQAVEHAQQTPDLTPFVTLNFYPEIHTQELPIPFTLQLDALTMDRNQTFRQYFLGQRGESYLSIFVKKSEEGRLEVFTHEEPGALLYGCNLFPMQTLPLQKSALETSALEKKEAKPFQLNPSSQVFIPKNRQQGPTIVQPTELLTTEQRIQALALKIAQEPLNQSLFEEMKRLQETIKQSSNPPTFIFGGPINPDLLAAANQQPIASTVAALTSHTSSTSTASSPAASTEESFPAITAQEPETSQSSAAAQAAPLTANPQNLKGATHKPLPENTIKPEDLEQLVKDGLTNKQLLEMGFVQADINQARENIEARKAAEQKQKGRADRRNAPAQITQFDKAGHEQTRPKPPKPETQQVHSISPKELENLIRAKVSDAELLNTNRGITQEDIDHAKREIARKDDQEEKEKRDAAAREKANIEAQARAQEKAEKADKAKLAEIQRAQQLERKLQSAQGQSAEPKKPKNTQHSASADSADLTKEKKAAQEKKKQQKAAQKEKEEAERRWLERLAAQNAQAANKKTFDFRKQRIRTKDDATAFIETVKKEPEISSDILDRLSEILDGPFNSQLKTAAGRIVLTKDWKFLPKKLHHKRDAIIRCAQKVGQEFQDPIIIMETIRGKIKDGFTKEAQKGLEEVRKIIDAVACPEQRATLNDTFDMVQTLANLQVVKTTLAIQEGARAFPGLPRIILSTEEQPQNTEPITTIIELLDGTKLISNRIIKEKADSEIKRLLDRITDPAAKKIIDSYIKGFETAAEKNLPTLQEALRGETEIILGLLRNSPDQQSLAQEFATINIPICLAYCKKIINSPETLTDPKNNINSLGGLLEVITTTQNRLALCNPELVEALEFFTDATTSWKLIMKNPTKKILETKLETLEKMIRHLNTNPNPNPNIKNGIERVACKYFQDLANSEISSTFPDELRKRLEETIPTMLPLIRANTYQEADKLFEKLPQPLQKKLKTDFKSFLALPEDTVPTVKHKRWQHIFTQALNSYNPDLKISQEELKSFLVTLANTISFGKGANQNLTDFFRLFGQLIEEKTVNIDPTIEFLNILNIGDGKFSSEEELAHSDCITTLLEVIQSLPEGQEKNKFIELFELYFKKIQTR